MIIKKQKMSNYFKEFFKRHGLNTILGIAALDGYRRQVLNDGKTNLLEGIKKERDSLSQERNSLSEYRQAAYDKSMEDMANNTKNKAANLRYSEAAEEHKQAVDNYKANPSEYTNKEMNRAYKKLEASFDEIKKLDISEILTSLYNNYVEYLDTLTPDKLVCLFNIIVDVSLVSSFFSVLSIMLIEKIINKMVFLEKYPRIIYLLNLRKKLNKTVIKLYLLTHFIFIIFGLSGNTFMFFL